MQLYLPLSVQGSELWASGKIQFKFFEVYTLVALKPITILLHKMMEVQVFDATDADIRTTAGPIHCIIFLHRPAG